MTIQCALGYVNGATLTRCGKTATAAQTKDNLNEPLNILHIGGLNAGARTPSGPPDSPVCTARLFEKDVLTFRVLVPAGSQTQEVYLQNETDPAINGTYRLQTPIRAADLQAFVTKYTDGRN